MDLIANILITVALVTVLFTLVMGFVAMQDRSDEARLRSNIWMRRRVTFQAVAIGVLFVAFAMKAAA